MVWNMTNEPKYNPVTTTKGCFGDDDRVFHDAHVEHGPWRVESRWELISGRGEPVSITIKRNDGRPMTASDVRALPLGDMLSESRVAVGRMAEWLLASRPYHAGFVATGPHRGRSQTEDEMEQTAAVYRDAYHAGKPVNAAVASFFHVASSTASKRIMKARAAGLLDGCRVPEPNRNGKAGFK